MESYWESLSTKGGYLMQYHRDKEYMTYVGHLIQHPKVQNYATFPTIFISNRLEHSIHVSYTSYKLKQNLAGMPESTARVGSCADLFLLWLARDQSLPRVTPGFIHALPWEMREKITDLNAKGKKISSLNTCGGGYPCSASLQRILRGDHGG